MKKKAIALIPFVARRVLKRRHPPSKKERGAKLGAPALLALGGAAAAFLLRRRKRSAAGHDVSPQDFRHPDPPGARAASSDGVSAVMPAMSADDPLVREQTDAAAAEAAAIGGPAPAPLTDEPTFGDDPNTRPVEEHAGNSYEAFSELENDR
jgi:uncharacterized protein (TIGR03382 family)